LIIWADPLNFYCVHILWCVAQRTRLEFLPVWRMCKYFTSFCFIFRIPLLYLMTKTRGIPCFLFTSDNKVSRSYRLPIKLIITWLIEGYQKSSARIGWKLIIILNRIIVIVVTRFDLNSILFMYKYIYNINTQIGLSSRRNAYISSLHVVTRSFIYSVINFLSVRVQLLRIVNIHFVFLRKNFLYFCTCSNFKKCSTCTKDKIIDRVNFLYFRTCTNFKKCSTCTKDKIIGRAFLF
jgi:hypothetical protein